ncbi:MAG: hypothetical protein LBS89_07990 [Zoogloeaceae bacterium]|jgi:hypothetical protein|nr:hypothetical protein [Zoogloeaceae bacterium]
MKKIFALCFFLLGLAVAPVVEARGIPIPVKFGSEPDISFLADTQLKEDDEGKVIAWKLGHKKTLEYLFFPYTVKDDGLVLYYQASAKSYYVMDVPEGEELAALQKEGLLPDPLPATKMTVQDYLFGYLLEILILALIAYGIWKKRRKKEPEETEPSGTSE